MLKYFIFLLMFSMSALQAGEKLSCDDLDGLAGSLDELATAFENAGTIETGGELDNALAEVIDALYAVADVEQERDLDTYVGNLESGWKKMDAGMFAQSMDDVIGSLDRLLKRDC
jgi:hypothetical protein